MENKELIWVTKEVAEEYKALDSDIVKADLVNELIRRKKISIDGDLESLEDDLIRFKGFASNYANRFKKAYEEQGDKINQIWEDCQEPIDKIHSKTKQMTNSIEKLHKDVKKISDELDNFNTYKIEKVIDLIDQYNRMTDEDKQIFSVILSSGKF